MAGAIRVVIADDDILLREGIASLLAGRDFDVVGQSGDGEQLVDLVRIEEPDLVLVDIRMPPTNSTEGLEAARLLRGERPGLAVVVLSAHIELEEAKDLLGQGARTAYLLKSRVIDVDQFVDTLHRVVDGESVLDPEIVEQLVRPRRASDPLDVLSPREHEVLALMAEGRSNSGIAHRLYVSEGTVEKHVRAILMKLDIIDAADDHRRVLAVLQYLEAR